MTKSNFQKVRQRNFPLGAPSNQNFSLRQWHVQTVALNLAV